MARTLLLIDDDELSREVLALYAEAAGYETSAVESGEAALELIASGVCGFDVILSDLQMPGVTGGSLARLLRAGCPAAQVVAMSGSEPPAQATAEFDGFLLKPFAMEDLEALLRGLAVAAPEPAATAVLNASIYKSLAASMTAGQLRALYAMCLDDADRRLEQLRAAAAARDADGFARTAHAIKGGCGMVGATELAGLAAAFETGGLPAVDDSGPFTQFLAASARLRVMLDAQTE